MRELYKLTSVIIFLIAFSILSDPTAAENEPPIADFYFYYGCTAPLPPGGFHFHDSSLYATEWKWDFGDGTSSYEQNPTHIYNRPARYNVILTVTNEYGTDSCNKWVAAGGHLG